MIDEAPSQGVVTSVTQTERLANSSAAIREQGAVLPVVVGISHVTPKSVGFAGLEYAGAYVTEAPAFAPGLEYPGGLHHRDTGVRTRPREPGRLPARGRGTG